MTSHDPAPDMETIRHKAVWGAIDSIADEMGISPSRLAILSGHDSTAFNKSKRSRGDELHWPSTRTVARVLHVAGMPHADFGFFIDAALRRKRNG